MGGYLGIHAVNVFVRDQERSVRFWVDQVGFHVAFDARMQSGDRWIAVAPPDGSAVLALIAPKPHSKQYQLIGRATQVVFVTEDVLGTYREWSSRGVRFRHSPRLRRIEYQQANSQRQPTAWGGVFTRFEDVDGNSFALASFDEVSRAVEEHRRELAARLEADRRAAQELEIAKNVQARLFPQAQPRVSTLEYAGVCMQARAVGGDYYDFLALGQNRLGLVIGDISGKGMAAALLMANLQANLRSQCTTALHDERELLRSVNRLFVENTTDSAYATLFFGEYDDAPRRLRYVNCGHLPALILRGDGGVDRLDSTATVLGLFSEWDCSSAHCTLEAGDTVVLYTDGVTESFSPEGEEFGEARLIEVLRRHQALRPDDLVRAVVEEVRDFSAGEQQDDVTIIVAVST